MQVFYIKNGVEKLGVWRNVSQSKKQGLLEAQRICLQILEALTYRKQLSSLM